MQLGQSTLVIPALLLIPQIIIKKKKKKNFFSLLLLDFQSWPVLRHSVSLLIGLGFVSMYFICVYMYVLQHQAGNLKELYRRRQLAVHGYVTTLN